MSVILVLLNAGATISADYVTEYSTDRIEMHVGALQPGQRVVLVDDLIATGGTLRELFDVYFHTTLG